MQSKTKKRAEKEEKEQIATVRMIFPHFSRSGAEKARRAHVGLNKEDAVIDWLHKPCVMRSQARSLPCGFRLD